MAAQNEEIRMGVAGVGLGALLLRTNDDPGCAIRVRGVFDTDPGRSHQRYDVGRSLEELTDEFLGIHPDGTPGEGDAAV